MGTRLMSEYLIKKYHPRLKYVRVHTSGKNKATLYAWNDQLELPEYDLTALLKFTRNGFLPSYVCYQVKEYSMVKKDNIPPAYELPERIIQTAMNSQLDQGGVIAVMNEMFSEGELIFNHYALDSGILHFGLRTASVLTEIEKELIYRYLYEIVPIGTSFEITF